MSEPWDSVVREEEEETKRLQADFMHILKIALVIFLFFMFLASVILMLADSMSTQEQSEWKQKQNRMLYGPGSCLTIQEHMVYCK